MEFISERTAYTMISDTIVKSGVSLFNAVKYIYMIADKDFYNINVKDIFKIALKNITDTTCLYNTGIKLDKERCKEMNSPSTSACSRLWYTRSPCGCPSSKMSKRAAAR